MKRAIERIQDLIRKQKYLISSHANEEMSEDNLESADLEQVVMSGKITKKFTRDPRGTRYEIAGKTIDGRDAVVVCRILAVGWLRIITAYTINGEA